MNSMGSRPVQLRQRPGLPAKQIKMKNNSGTPHRIVLRPVVTAFVCWLFASGCAGPGSGHAKAPKRVLVVTTTMGFRHSSIPTAEKVLAELARQSGAFTVDYARVEPNDAAVQGCGRQAG